MMPFGPDLCADTRLSVLQLAAASLTIAGVEHPAGSGTGLLKSWVLLGRMHV